MRAGDRGGEARYLDLYYPDIVRDPIAAVRAVYAHAGMTLGDPAENAMRAFLTANPQARHGVHRYTLEQFGLDRERENARYAAYRARFAIGREESATLR